MPITGGRYVAPAWANGAQPAISAEELSAMSGTLQDTQTLTSRNAPTSSVAAVVGQRYVHIQSNGILVEYRCIAATSAGTTWQRASEDGDATTFQIMQMRSMLLAKEPIFSMGNVMVNAFAENSGMADLGGWAYSTSDKNISVTSDTSGTDYYYSRYTYTQGATTYSQGTDTLTDSRTGSGKYEISGKPNYSFDAASGVYSLGGTTQTEWAYPDNDDVDVYLYELADAGATLISYHLYADGDFVYLETYERGSVASTPAPVKGSLVDTITAGANQYPLDGVSGSYWYVRGEMVPGAGSTVEATTSTYTLASECSRVLLYAIDSTTDADNGSVLYQVSLDGGANYNDAAIGQTVECTPGNSLVIRILAAFTGAATTTCACAGVGAVCV